MTTNVAPRKIVALCGSSGARRSIAWANLTESLAGNIVLDLAPDAWKLSAAEVENLHILHRAKIDIADEVLVVNPYGYIGDSTKSEIEYARTIGKTIRYVEPLE